MELSEIQDLVPEYSKLMQKMMAAKPNTAKVLDLLKQYEPEEHEVIKNVTDRQDKTVVTDDQTKVVKVARLAIPVQKKIVGLAAAFLCGNPIKLAASPADDVQKQLLEVVKKTWTSNKLDYEAKKLAKIMMSETEVAELWYSEEADPLYWQNTPNQGKKFRLRMKVIANSLGDGLYPVFNNNGDMVAFGRSYSIKVNDKNEEHFDVYTDNKIYKGTKSTTGYAYTEEANMINKIPVIYYYQPKVEWADVQTLIDRWEKTLSNHSDTNDYFASPMVKVKGEIIGFASKGESGKVLEIKDGGDAEYMSWDQSPKSLELEFKNLRSLIFDFTDTPDISIEQMKALGTYSGIALKMLFLAPHLKAADKEENFGKSVQRRINFIKAAMAVINVGLEKATALDITPRFEYYLPKNESEMIEMLVSATGSKPIMTVDSAVRRNPLVDNADVEIEKLKDETVIEDITP